MWFLTFVWKNLFRRKIRSVMTILGVTIAVGAMVALVGMSRGFEQSMLSIYEQRDVDLLVTKAGKAQRLTSFLDESIADRLAALPGVARVAGGLVDFTSFEEGGPLPVSLNGVQADSPMIEDLKLLEGNRLQAGERRTAMIGRKLAERLDKKVGDAVEIELEEFRVVGVFESRVPLEDDGLVLLLDDMQDLLDLPGKVTGFVVVMDEDHEDEASVKAMCHRIKNLCDESGTPLKLDAKPIGEFVSTTMEIRSIKAMAWGTSTIALLIGGIAVFNTMIMSVFERTAEIGILRGIGWRRLRIIRLILLESVVLSVVGGMLGALCAVGLVRLLAGLPQASGFLSAGISPEVIAQGMCLGLLLGALAGLYPAIRAARLTPTEAIRHE